MSISPHPEEAALAPIPPDLVRAGAYGSYREGFEHGLVILAMGRPCWLLPADGGFGLWIEPEAAETAGEQLARFDRESIGWPPPAAAVEVPAGRTEWTAPMLWALLVLAVYSAQLRSPGRWESAADLDPGAILRHGQVWRLGTALFLHADFGHLLSNLLFGVFAFSAVLTTLGRWRGLALLAAASVGGNLAVTAIHLSTPYRSLGASTAIFAGLGLLTGHAVRNSLSGGRLRILAPLVAGGSLLALYGAGGANVDVLAHLCGFAVGLILGFATPPRADPQSAP